MSIKAGLAYAAAIVDDSIPSTRGAWTLVPIVVVCIIAAYHTFLFIDDPDPNVTSAMAVAAVVVSFSPVLTSAFTQAFFLTEDNHITTTEVPN